MRKVITPARDMLATQLAGVAPLPGMTPEAERYFRDVYDHLIRISDLGGQLPRPAEWCARHAPVDRLEPAERRHEATGDHCHALPATHSSDALLCLLAMFWWGLAQ